MQRLSFNMSVNGAPFGKVEPTLVEAMFRLRHKIFSEQLKWTARRSDRQEIDDFDALDPVYLILQHGQAVVGCARLLRTTGPHMLPNVFAAALNGAPAPRSPRIWESTRFAIDAEYLAALRIRPGLATSHLIAGVMEVAMAAGLEGITSVYDPRIERVLRRAGCTIRPLGEAIDQKGEPILAGYFPVTFEILARIRMIGGIERPLLPALEQWTPPLQARLAPCEGARPAGP